MGATMTIEYPPPRLLWYQLLTRCSSSELERFRLDTIIRLAYAIADRTIEGQDDLEHFLDEVKREIRRRESAHVRTRRKTPLRVSTLRATH